MRGRAHGLVATAKPEADQGSRTRSRRAARGDTPLAHGGRALADELGAPYPCVPIARADGRAWPIRAPTVDGARAFLRDRALPLVVPQRTDGPFRDQLLRHRPSAPTSADACRSTPTRATRRVLTAGGADRREAATASHLCSRRRRGPGRGGGVRRIAWPGTRRSRRAAPPSRSRLRRSGASRSSSRGQEACEAAASRSREVAAAATRSAAAVGRDVERLTGEILNQIVPGLAGRGRPCRRLDRGERHAARRVADARRGRDAEDALPPPPSLPSVDDEDARELDYAAARPL